MLKQTCYFNYFAIIDGVTRKTNQRVGKINNFNMKKTISKGGLLFVMALSLFACQTESLITSTKAEMAMPMTGAPSAADDMYQFATKEYYIGSKKVTDTLEIKDLLNKALVTQENDENNRVDMYFEKSDLAKLGIDENYLPPLTSEAEIEPEKTARGKLYEKKAAVDADNHMLYLFERTMWNTNAPAGGYVYQYIVSRGVFNYNSLRKMYQYGSGGLLSAMAQVNNVAGQPVGDINYWNSSCKFTINFANLTNQKRLITFVLDSPSPGGRVYKRYYLDSQYKRSVSGSATGMSDNERYFGGTQGVLVAHYSARVY